MFTTPARSALVLLACTVATTASAMSFEQSEQALGSANSRKAALLDFDNDGDLDAAVANTAGIQLWVNDGLGVFSDGGVLGSADAHEVDAGDLDNDGDLDLYVAVNGTDQVWSNDGSGSFTDAGATHQSGFTTSATLGDLDHDGDLDLVTMDRGAGGKVETFVNDGSGVFAPHATPEVAGSASLPSGEVQLVDFNGDGELDLAFAAYGTAYLYRNTGGGVFTLNDDVTVGFGNHRPATVWGDLNDDGAEDVVVLGDDGRLEQAYLNDGAGDFGDVAQEFQVTSSTYGAALADFDLDGDLDMLGVHNGGGSAAVWDNDGLGVFSDSGAALPQRSASFGAVAGDLNGDSVPDAFGVGNGPNTVWFNTTVFGDEDGDGVVDPADVCPGSDDLADIDGDTVPDGCDACLGTDASGDADGDGLCTDWQPDLAPELVLVPGEVLELEVTAQPDTTLFLMVGRELGEGGCPVWMRTACFGIVAPRLLQTTTSDPEGTATFTIDATGWAGPMGSRAMQVGFVGIDGSVYLGSPSVVGADL